MRPSRASLHAWIMVAAALPAWVGGCSARNEDILDFLQAHEHEVSAIEYRVGIPDVIAVRAPHVQEIDGDTQRIQPDGKISLRLLGDVRIVGLTAKEIAAKLELLASKYYVDPQVNVRVAHYASKKYFVFRETGQGASVPYTGRDTILDVVANSGSTFLAWTANVKIIRPHPTEDGRRVIRVDVDKMVRTGDVTANVLIEPNDIVYIPPTPLAWLGFRIREVLWPLNPMMEAYVAPAQVIAAKDVYDDEDGNSARATTIGPITTIR